MKPVLPHIDKEEGESLAATQERMKQHAKKTQGWDEIVLNVSALQGGHLPFLTFLILILFF